jgi:hypothetical protein
MFDNFFFWKSCRLWDNEEKYSIAVLRRLKHVPCFLNAQVCLSGVRGRWQQSDNRNNKLKTCKSLIFLNNQLDTNSFSYMFISILCIFRAAICPSSGEFIVSIRHLVYVTLYKWPFGVQVCTSTPNGHLQRVTYTRCRIDTINSPDDGHMAVRNL